MLDVAPRHRVRAAAGLHGAGVLELLAGRRGRGHGARHLRDPVPPRGRAHALRAGDPDALPDRGLRLRADLVAGVDRRGPDRGGSARRSATRRVDLRPLRRRRLLGRRAARAPRDRRPADVRVRRPRADAQGRGRAGDQRLPRHVQGAARGRRRRDALPGRSSKASPSRRPSARRSAPSSSASSRRRRRAWRRRTAARTRAFSCRARCTRT